MNDDSHISQPDKNGLQVRITRRKIMYSRYFAFKTWGGPAATRAAARFDRDDKLNHMVGKQIRFVNASKNESTGVTGISRCVRHDKRKDKSYMTFSVFWKLNGKNKTRTFQAGNVDSITDDDEAHAFRTAMHFRKNYEYCIDHNKFFNDLAYTQWQTKKLYELIEIPKE